MKGEFSGMRALILKETSCMRTDRIRKNYRKKVEEGICNRKLNTGNVLNQELSLQKPANTRWGTHYKTLLRIIEFFSCIIEFLEYIQDEDVDNIKRRQANGLLKYFHTFDFAFYLQLMLHILGFADILSQALQRRDQDILNVMSLVASTKREVHNLRDDGWDDFLAKVCTSLSIYITNLHHYKVDYYYDVLDMQLQAFNDLFDEVNSELLFCIASLSPMDSFSQFKKSMLVRLTELYLDDFSFLERISLDHQLDIYLDNEQRDERFTNFKSLGDLARVMLALILPVATTTVERYFSTMNIVKTALRNQISDTFFSDCLVCFIENMYLIP
ncbi:putative ribonuclease H-like superfamily [Arabidopsis thaliana]